MQLKKQGSSYSVIRTKYSSEKGRGVPTSLGTIAVGSTLVPEKIATQLTAAELSDVQQKLNAFAEESKKSSDQFAVNLLAFSVSRAAEKINAGVRFSSESEVVELYKSIAELKAALRKAGYKRPRPPAALGASHPAGQQQAQ
ncbi:hypothetical protein ACJJWD_25470 (plasmid) [Comamonas testosteroni]|uniref:hypothetical protein n=1 Tax=Comamonas testosteroni TaxID=285 RepID=UPI003899FD19